MKRINRFFLVAIAASAMIFSSCDNKDEKDPPEEGEQILFGPNKTQIGNGDKEFYITESHTIKQGVYTMVGWIYVEAGATLTIEPGTIIKCTDISHDGSTHATGSSLVILRGAKIMAEGTREKPIVFTSNQPKGQRQPADWGGIIICGYANNNMGEMDIEGGVTAPHGGTDNNDNSGVMRYVRIEFGGYPFAPDTEINGLTMGSVGRGTTLEYIQVSYCGDDSFEWFGGSVDAKYLIAYHGWDDDFDTDNGFSGRIQFALGVRDPKIADISNSNGFESDNNNPGNTNTPFTTAVFSNVTIIGPLGQDENFANNPSYVTGYNWGHTANTAVYDIKPGIFQAAAQVRRNSRLSVFNSALTGYPVGILIDNDRGNSQAAALDDGNYLKFKNVFLAGMGRVGATNNSTSASWRDGGVTRVVDEVTVPVDLEGFTSEGWFRAGSGNQVFDDIGELMLRDFKSKALPLPATGFAPNNPNANWGPTTGSPLRAAGAADFTDPLVNNSFFTKVNYAGAFASDSDADNWTRGWANFDPQNTDY